MTADSGEAEELLTVAEAAARLRVTERRLRRLLARPENAARTRRVTRRTVTGERGVTVLPPDLFLFCAAVFEIEENAAQGNGNGNTAQRGAPEEHGAGTRRGEQPTALTLAAVYERLIAEKDAHLASKEAEVTRLTARLEALESALAREQTLRALLPAGPAPQSDEQQATPEATAAGAQAEAPQRRARSWWQRWRRRYPQ